VSAMTEEMSAQAEEVTASAQSLADMAQALQELAGQFTLAEEAAVIQPKATARRAARPRRAMAAVGGDGNGRH